MRVSAIVGRRKSLYICILRQFTSFTYRFKSRFRYSRPRLRREALPLARLTSNRLDVSPTVGVPPSGGLPSLKSLIPGPSRPRAPSPRPPRKPATNLSRNSPVSRRPVTVLLYTIEGQKPRGGRTILVFLAGRFGLTAEFAESRGKEGRILLRLLRCLHRSRVMGLVICPKHGNGFMFVCPHVSGAVLANSPCPGIELRAYRMFEDDDTDYTKIECWFCPQCIATYHIPDGSPVADEDYIERTHELYRPMCPGCFSEWLAIR